MGAIFSLNKDLLLMACATTGLCFLYYYKQKQYLEKQLKIANELFEFPKGLDILNNRKDIVDLTRYTIFSERDPDRVMVLNKLKKDKIFIDETFDRAMGSFLGNVIGDALGAPFEFDPLCYDTTEMKNGFADVEIWKNRRINRFLLEPGQWTDDASMALCLADSLLVKEKFDPLDLRLRFFLWWNCGYCNAFGYDNKRPKASVGLGGNIRLSMVEFAEKKSEYTTAGDKKTSGNGSIMRNAAIPIFYFKNSQEAQDKAVKQSKTTHQGDEAAECCKLLTHIVIRALKLGKSASVETVLLDPELSQSFETPLYSVYCLASSQAEERHRDNEGHNLEDRNWNWKNSEFKYSPDRSKKMPGYVGSYSMDCLAMALHCVCSTNSFVDALLKCANLRGDSDTVCAVTGQIAGAIYGSQDIPKDWINAILKWDPKGYIPLRAYKLYTKGLALND